MQLSSRHRPGRISGEEDDLTVDDVSAYVAGHRGHQGPYRLGLALPASISGWHDG